jgi:hypothetical protein
MSFKGAGGRMCIRSSTSADCGRPEKRSPSARRGRAAEGRHSRVFAPTLVIMLYNPSAPMDVDMRLYATCREMGLPLSRPSGWPKSRTMGGAVDLFQLGESRTRRCGSP